MTHLEINTKVLAKALALLTKFRADVAGTSIELSPECAAGLLRFNAKWRVVLALQQAHVDVTGEPATLKYLRTLVGIDKGNMSTMAARLVKLGYWRATGPHYATIFVPVVDVPNATDPPHTTDTTDAPEAPDDDIIDRFLKVFNGA